jgi:hypothetical protein
LIILENQIKFGGFGNVSYLCETNEGKRGLARLKKVLVDSEILRIFVKQITNKNINDEIRDIAKTEWSKVYDKTSKNPGSVMLEAREGVDIAQVMFVPSDKYISVNEERANYLIETYGEDAVEEKTTFSFDNEMVDKYGEVLSELISACDEIDEDDKGRIIKAVRAFSVKKGAIDKFKDFAEEADASVSEIVEEFKPVVSLKNVEVIKG